MRWLLPAQLAFSPEGVHAALIGCWCFSGASCSPSLVFSQGNKFDLAGSSQHRLSFLAPSVSPARPWGPRSRSVGTGAHYSRSTDAGAAEPDWPPTSGWWVYDIRDEVKRRLCPSVVFYFHCYTSALM